MTEASPAAEPTVTPAGAGCLEAAIATYLTGPLRDYFTLTEQAPVPPRLTALIGRFETVLAEPGDRLANGFRSDLLRDLLMLRTFAMSLSANEARGRPRRGDVGPGLGKPDAIHARQRLHRLDLHHATQPVLHPWLRSGCR